MERLTTRNIAGVAVFKESYGCENCNESIWRLPDYGNGSPTERLAQYEEAEEQGFLLWLPCRLGSTVYVVKDYLDCEYSYNCPLGYAEGKNNCEKGFCCDHEYKRFFINETTFNINMIDKIGKSVFLTKEEAEQKIENK